MQVKLFVQDKSPFRSWRGFLERIETEINAWLAENPDIRVVDIKQSSNGGSFDTSKVFISIWYEWREAAVPVSEEQIDVAKPRGPGITSRDR
jgi:hypothetical protein